MRKLYTDSDQVLFEHRRPVVLASVEELIGRQDLQDRLLRVELPTVSGASRLTEEEADQRFDELKPELLGALLNCVVAALRSGPHLRLTSLPRMASAYKFIKAAEPTLGFPVGTFDAALNQVHADSAASIIDGSTVAEFVRGLVQLMNPGDVREDSPTDLLDSMRLTWRLVCIEVRRRMRMFLAGKLSG